MTAAAFIGCLPQLRIVVIGDAMLDHYIIGDALRISPEAPVPVVHVERDDHKAGGAANVALNLAVLGVRAALAARLGNDAAGGDLVRVLAGQGVDTSGCEHVPGLRTIVKARVMARGHQLCRIDREEVREAYRYDPADAALDALLADTHAVILSDYAKGVVTQELVGRVLERCRKHGILCAADPKPARHLDYHGVGLLTPNRHEALELAGLPEPHPGEPYPLDAVFAAIHGKHAPGLLAVTLGAEGMAIGSGGKVNHKLPTEARAVFDVSGAGDTVIAALTAALAAGAAPEDAARLANQCAGIVVSKPGTATVTPEELAQAAHG